MMRLTLALFVASFCFSGLQGYAVGTVAGGVVRSLFQPINEALKGASP